MESLPACPTCQGPKVRRKGVTAAGVQMYLCLNPVCPRPGFRGAYTVNPFNISPYWTKLSSRLGGHTQLT
jgi:hypothetical protein